MKISIKIFDEESINAMTATNKLILSSETRYQ